MEQSLSHRAVVLSRPERIKAAQLAYEKDREVRRVLFRAGQDLDAARKAQTAVEGELLRAPDDAAARESFARLQAARAEVSRLTAEFLAARRAFEGRGDGRGHGPAGAPAVEGALA